MTNELFDRLVNRRPDELGWNDFVNKWKDLDDFGAWVGRTFLPTIAPCWKNHEGARIEMEMLYDWLRQVPSPNLAFDALGALNTFLHRSESFDGVCTSQPCRLSDEYKLHVEALKSKHQTDDI